MNLPDNHGNKLLEVKNLSVTYKNRGRHVYAVRDVSFSLGRSESMGIVGESGSGKSTLALALLRLLPENSAAVSGSAEFLSRGLFELSGAELRDCRWKHMAVVFQKSMNSFSPVHRVGSQIEDIYRIHSPKASQQEVYGRITALFRLVNLNERVYRLYPHELSGGMLQRVSIAVSLLHNPDLLIMDEATTALDVITQSQILKEITAMESGQASRLMITHDMSVVAGSCGKIAVMYAGEIMETGYTRDVLKNPVHPYTKGLLASFPSLKGGKAELKSIPGALPDLSEKPEGCAFAPRCAQARPECRKGVISGAALENGRWIKCVLERNA
jgi:peptide/nickel transport system ATP-binding protein